MIDLQTRLRALDLVIVVATMPVWLPVLVVVGVAVRLTSGRPVLFRQVRAGRDGKPFTMHKFRTMTTGPNPLIPDPDRFTPIGGWLRRTSLDELPQLIDVLRGRMSLVGPRPMLPEQAAVLDYQQRQRHRLRPGLTGTAQTSGRNQIDWPTRVALDLDWIEQAGVARYLTELARTPAAVIDLRGVSGHDPQDPLALDEPVEEAA